MDVDPPEPPSEDAPVPMDVDPPEPPSGDAPVPMDVDPPEPAFPDPPEWYLAPLPSNSVARISSSLPPVEERDQVVSLMLSRSGHSQPSPENRRKLLDALRPVPVEVLRTVERHGASMVILTEQDTRGQADWTSGSLQGQYQVAERRIVLHERYLGRHETGIVVPVHEMGHAYEFAVADLHPRESAVYVPLRDQAYARMAARGVSSFPTAYAATNPQELEAESFAILFGEQPAWLDAVDPQWAGTMRAFVGLADPPRSCR